MTIDDVLAMLALLVHVPRQCQRGLQLLLLGRRLLTRSARGAYCCMILMHQSVMNCFVRAIVADIVQQRAINPALG